jgi:3-isopropylmalate/(R)-2-methylmalate dehydratase small subunit
VIAPSFADIFFNNSCKNGLLPVVLKEEEVDELFRHVSQEPGLRIQVDLQAKEVRVPGGPVFHFDLDEYRRHRLLEGLDDIALTLQHAQEIRAYEARRREEAPWLMQGR